MPAFASNCRQSSPKAVSALAAISLCSQHCVIGRDDQRGVAATGRIGLNQFPNLANEVVGAIGCSQLLVILASIRQFVGIAEADEDRARLVLPQHFKIQAGRQRIGRVTAMQADIHRQAAALVVQDIGKYIPGADRLDLVGKIRTMVEPLQERDVLVGTRSLKVIEWSGRPVRISL